MANVSEQVVLVTGAGTGIGAAIAGAFLESGAMLAATYHGSAAGAQRLDEAARAAGRPALVRQVDSRDVEREQRWLLAKLLRGAGDR